MRGLTLWQPWAQLVAVGAKRIETRSWSSPWRGVLAIHAAKRFPPEARDLCFLEPFKSALRPTIGRHGALVSGDEANLPLGVIVATARLVNCWRTSGYGANDGQPAPWLAGLSEQERAFGDYSANRYGWVLADVRALPEPIPCRGAQGLWEVPADVVALIERQLAGRASL